MKRVVSAILLIVALFSVVFGVIADTPKERAQLENTGISHYLIAPNNEFTLDNAMLVARDNWLPIKNRDVSFGYDARTYWFKMDIPASESKQLLHLAYPLLDELDIYFVRNGLAIANYQLGDTLPFRTRPIAHEDFVVPIPRNQNVTAYFRVKTSSSMNVPVIIWPANEFHAVQARIQLSFGIYFGVLLCMVLYNLFGFAVIREASVFSYSIYVVFVGLMASALTGVGFRYIWPNNIWLQDHALVLFGCLSFAFAAIFIAQLLKIKEYSKLFTRGLWLMGGSSFTVAFVSVFLAYSVAIKLLLVFAILSCTFLVVLAVSMWRKGSVYARIFALAWAAFIGAIFLNSLAYLGVIDTHFMQRYAIMVGSGIEVLLLSWVLTLRYSDERLQKLVAQDEALRKSAEAQEAQRQLNEKLEQRVDERTFELEMALRELQEVNHELERKNSEDSLTSLFNRRHFDRQLTAEFRRAWRDKQPVALIMLDIDYFKQVNDNHGHMIGDQILVALAKRLKQSARRPSDGVFRYGGEEFAVLLGNTGVSEAAIVADNISTAVSSEPFNTDVGPLSITVSLGISVAEKNVFDVPEQLLKTADDALYAAKERGRNQIVIAQHIIDSNIAENSTETK